MRNSIVVKFIAVFLCALGLLTAVASGYGVYRTAKANLYDDGDIDTQKQQLRTNLRTLAEKLAVRYAALEVSNCEEALVDAYVGNSIDDLFVADRWYYTIHDKAGELVDSNSTAYNGEVQQFQFAITPEYPVILDTTGKVGISFDPEILFPQDAPDAELPEDELPERDLPEQLREISFPWSDGIDDHRYTLGIFKKDTYRVTIFLLEGAYEYQDSLEWRILELGYRHRYTMMVTLVIGLLLFFGSGVYLCTAAARSPIAQERRAGGLNRLPLDLYLLLAATGIFFLSLAILRLIQWTENPPNLTPGLSGIALCGYGAALLFVGFWFAVAAQSNTPGGMWWRNMLLVRLGIVLLRLCKTFSLWFGEKCRHLRRLLPVVWQWLLLGLILLLVGACAFFFRSLPLTILTVVLYLFTVLYTGYSFGVLMEGAKRMSRGKLDYRIGGKWLRGLFRDFADYLNDLANVAVVAARKESRSERMKAELITNVSHDIKTPLTSIISYVDLLQKASSPEEARDYLEVLDRQSLRLKKLIDDLMEMSKASTGNMTVEPVMLDAAESVNQALGEFSDKLEARGLTVVFTPPEQQISILADGRLTWRVLSNLLSNVVKYAMEGTRVYVDVLQVEGNVLVSVKNISAQPLNISSDELMERFVRGDTSRNTEGSGLGLNIAKSLMELQKGQLHLLVDGDLFKATLVFPQK